MRKQKTIKKEISLPQGVGLHTGQKVSLKFRPAGINEGINFIRVDIDGKPIVPANISHIIDAAKRPRRTSVGINSVEVHTIEHVMAALFGLEIDNVFIEVNAEELPGYDGSALPFYEALKKAEVTELEAPKKTFQVRNPLWIEEENGFIIILPGKGFRVSYTLNYEHVFLKSQYVSLVFNENIFGREIAPSRTFCLEDEVDDLRSLGLGKGADFENTLVVTKNGISGNNKLRFPDEFVRHKISDLLGDLYLLGSTIEGHVVASRSGHPLNIRLLQKIKLQFEKFKEAGVAARLDRIESIPPLDIKAIQRILPHRYPFLLIDRIVELQEDDYVVGVKNVTINEQFFNGHFPGHPVMPGVLILEAMAQVAGVMMLSKNENLGKIAYFMSMDKVKFRKTVVPGDQLVLRVKVIKLRSRVIEVRGEAFVDGKIVAEAELRFSLGGE